MNQETVKQAIADTGRAGAIICSASKRASDPGAYILGRAHTYLYGAMFADFVVQAEREIGPGVLMQDGKVIPAREFVIDTFFDDWFNPLKKQFHGEEFLLEVKYKLRMILECKPAPPIPPTNTTPAEAKEKTR